MYINRANVISQLLVAIFAVIPLFFVNCSEVGFQDKASDSLNGLCVGSQSEGCAQGIDPDDDGDPTDDPRIPIDKLKTFDLMVPGATNLVDVLLVIDNSISMNPERRELAERLSGFTQKLDSEGIDWQMCHTYTDMQDEKGRAVAWVGINNIVLTRNAPNKAQIFRDSISDIEEGDGDEQGVRATYEALEKPQNQNCFRSNSALAVILLSDEDERSCGGRFIGEEGYGYESCRVLNLENTPEHLINHVGSKFGATKPFTYHSIVIRPEIPGVSPTDFACMVEQLYQGYQGFFGEVYAQTSILTGGVIGSVCEDNYTNQLDTIGDVISQSLDSVPLECSPLDNNVSIQVYDESGNPVALNASLEGNKLVFDPALPEGYRVTGSYICRE